MYAKNLSEPKYEFLIKKREDARMKHLNDPTAFIACSNTMQDIYEDSDDYNPTKKRKVLLFLMTWLQRLWLIKNFKLLWKLFIRCRKLNISFVFISQSYFLVPKNVRLNSTHYLIMKTNNKRELQNIAINHSADIYYQDFIKIYRKCTKEPHNFFDNWHYITIK